MTPDGQTDISALLGSDSGVYPSKTLEQDPPCRWPCPLLSHPSRPSLVLSSILF